MLALPIAFFGQLSGINAILYVAARILAMIPLEQMQKRPGIA
jgi:hypothetical protein